MTGVQSCALPISESEIASGLQVLLGCTEPTILEGPWDIAGSIRMLDDGVKTML